MEVTTWSEALWQKDRLGRFSDHAGRNASERRCVQLRLACSAGVSPAGVGVRSPVVWIAGWRETKTLKPIDKASFGEVNEPSGRNESERKSSLENSRSEGRAFRC